jgi:hypothetical protein
MKSVAMAAVFMASTVLMAQQAGSQTHLSGLFRAPMPGDPAGNGPAFYLTFFPDGHVMRGAPDVGLAGYNAAYQMNLDIRSGITARIWRWGVYKVSGQQGTINFADRMSISFEVHQRQFLCHLPAGLDHESAGYRWQLYQWWVAFQLRRQCSIDECGRATLPRQASRRRV